MTSNTPNPATRLVTMADLEVIAGELGEGLARAVKPVIAALEARVAAVEADAISLRRELSTKAIGPGVRRKFTDAQTDPEQPGHTLLRLDDGSAVSLPDQRLHALAGVRMAGRA